MLLGGPFADFSPAGLRELAAPLRARVRAVGLSVETLSDLPLDMVQRPFLVVSFKPGALNNERAEADLRQAMDAIHRAGSKVLAHHVAPPRQARTLIELGADFVCGTVPETTLGAPQAPTVVTWR